MSQEPSRKRQKTTPRNSLNNKVNRDDADETPIAQLRQLANITRKAIAVTPQNNNGPRQISVRTPASIAGAISARRTPRSLGPTRTPIVQNTIRSRPAPVRQGPPTTPHAIRALQQRRNATPGRQYDARRRSGVQQRETPQNDLRALGKLLRAKQPRTPVEPQPEAAQSATQRRRPRMSVTFDGEEPLDPAPRLSMPLLDEQDEDSWNFEAAPNMSNVYGDDEDLTSRSVEASRRAMLQDARGRRISDDTLRNLGDLSGLNLTEEEQARLMTDIGDDPDDLSQADITFDAGGDETGEIRRLLGDRRRSSGFDMVASPGTDGEPTFVFRIPEQARRRSTLGQTVQRLDDGDEVENQDAESSDELAEEDLNDEQVVPTIEPELHVDLDGQQFGNDTTLDKVIDESASSDDEEEDEPILHASRKISGSQLKLVDTTLQSIQEPTKIRTNEPRQKYTSRHGIEYSSLPSSTIKKIATTIIRSTGSKSRLDKDTLASLSQATDWFFEQVADDLGAYARHAKRKTIEEADVIMLMKRQKVVSDTVTPFALASKLLPRELSGQVRVSAAKKGGAGGGGGGKCKRLAKIAEEEED